MDHVGLSVPAPPASPAGDTSSNQFWDYLYSQQVTGNLCDIRLFVRYEDGEGEALNAHKVILAAGSEFFRNLLDSGELLDMYNFDGIQLANLQVVLDYIYHQISWEELNQTTEAAEIAHVLGVSKERGCSLQTPKVQTATPLTVVAMEADETNMTNVGEGASTFRPLVQSTQSSQKKSTSRVIISDMDAEFKRHNLVCRRSFIRKRSSGSLEKDNRDQILPEKDEPQEMTWNKGEAAAERKHSVGDSNKDNKDQIDEEEMYQESDWNEGEAAVENLLENQLNEGVNIEQLSGRVLEEYPLNVETKYEKSEKEAVIGLDTIPNPLDTGEEDSGSKIESTVVNQSKESAELQGIPRIMLPFVSVVRLPEFVNHHKCVRIKHTEKLTEPSSSFDDTQKITARVGLPKVQQHRVRTQLSEAGESSLVGQSVADTDETLKQKKKSPEKLRIGEVHGRRSSRIQVRREAGKVQSFGKKIQKRSHKGMSVEVYPKCDPSTLDTAAAVAVEECHPQRRHKPASTRESTKMPNELGHIQAIFSEDMKDPACSAEKIKVELHDAASAGVTQGILVLSPDADISVKVERDLLMDVDETDEGKNDTGSHSSGVNPITESPDSENVDSAYVERIETALNNIVCGVSAVEDQTGDGSVEGLTHSMSMMSSHVENDENDITAESMHYLTHALSDSIESSEKDTRIIRESETKGATEHTQPKPEKAACPPKKRRRNSSTKKTTGSAPVSGDFVCTLCNKAFKNVTGLSIHEQWKHNKKREGLDDSIPRKEKLKPQTCDMCGAETRSFAGLVQHMKSKHNVHPKLKCEHCGEEFTTSRRLRDHQSKSHGMFHYHCDKCGATFVSPEGWKVHMLKKHTETQERLVCEICGKAFKMKHELASHMSHTHVSSSQYPCQLCKSSFKTKASLKRHLRTFHSDIRRFECPACPAKFKTKEDMKRHHALHFKPSQKKGRKPSSTHDKACKYCQKVFLKPSNARAHERLHSEKQQGIQYMCVVCSKSFPVRNYLMQHVRTAHLPKRHKCPQCMYEFPMAYLLKKHLPKCKGFPYMAKPFRCPHCFRYYNLKGNLTKHLHQNRCRGKKQYMRVTTSQLAVVKSSDAAEIIPIHQLSADTLQASEALQQLQSSTQPRQDDLGMEGSLQIAVTEEVDIVSGMPISVLHNAVEPIHVQQIQNSDEGPSHAAENGNPQAEMAVSIATSITHGQVLPTQTGLSESGTGHVLQITGGGDAVDIEHTEHEQKADGNLIFSAEQLEIANDAVVSSGEGHNVGAISEAIVSAEETTLTTQEVQYLQVGDSQVMLGDNNVVQIQMTEDGLYQLVENPEMPQGFDLEVTETQNELKMEDRTESSGAEMKGQKIPAISSSDLISR